MSEDIISFRLENGIRVVFQKVKNTQLVHVGVVVNAGSRDETAQNNGVAHFIEHAVFKGTKKRKAFQLFNLVESVGGEVNAYTTRENTAFYATSLKRYLGRALDLISDMIFSSLFEERDMEKEKKVIYEEIEMYQDSPEDAIYDEFYELLYPHHSLGYNILGTKDSLNGLKVEDLNSFIATEYSADRMVISICGNTTLNKVEALTKRYFEHHKLNFGQVKRSTVVQAPTFNERRKKDFIQSHCMMGCEAYSRYNPNRFGLMLLNNVLGGNNMSSRLNLSVREKHGYTYNISSNYAAYDDTGLFSVSFACDEENVSKSIKLINKELTKLKQVHLGSVQLNIAKRQLQGSLAMMMENPGTLMQNNAKSILFFDRSMPLMEVFEAIEKVSAQQVQDIANELFAEEKMNYLIYESE